MKKAVLLIFGIILSSCGNQVYNNTPNSSIITNSDTIPKTTFIDGRNIKVTGKVTEQDYSLPGAYVNIKGTKIVTTTDDDGKYTIYAKKTDQLQFSYTGLENKTISVGNILDNNNFNKKNKNNDSVVINVKMISYSIQLEKPVIYLYPKEKTDVSVYLDYKGIIQTTFPKYNNEWKVTAYPDGKLFDKNSKRFYNSLFWDGTQTFSNEHYSYKDGFIVEKNNLTSFLISKLEAIGLNDIEINEFVQYWLPSMEKNKLNFVHFWINDDYDGTSKSIVSPKPDSTVRVFMEFYGLKNPMTIEEQQLSKIERKGFTFVEWGGSDLSEKFKNNL